MKTLVDKLEELVWVLRFGRPRRKISAEGVISNLNLIKNPVFFLSTGRCGTNWFSDILDIDPGVKVLHAPNPSFSVQNAYLYGLWKNKKISELDKFQFVENLFSTGREQHLRYYYKCDKRYIETNNHITFFAPALARMFPDALFVHLYRHPGEFVRSGIRRGWFGQNQDATQKIIQPPVMNDNTWNEYSQIEKVSWVWNETNQFVEDFLSGLDPERYLSFNFNEKDKNSMDELFRFVQVDLSFDKLGSIANKRVNIQGSGNFPKYGEWAEESKNELRSICGELAEKYNYVL